MRRTLFLFFTFLSFYSFAQELEHRLIVFGDAGEINNKQTFLIEKSHALKVDKKTTAFFVGDNIYEFGMALSAPENMETAKILQSQYEGFRKLDVPVYFLAGNHDWDKSKKDGLAKLKAQEQFILDQKDPGLKFIPKAGTIGPEAIHMSERLTVITYDSEYWLFPHHGRSIEQDKDEFIAELGKLLEEHQDKRVILISHHPMLTFGEHALKYTWRDHLFPLTRLWKGAYLPLPGLGSLYPLLRSTAFASPEDIKHPFYSDLIARVTEVSKFHPNLIFVSGHDHGLQYIDKEGMHQIVSGSGAKTSEIRKDESLKFRYNKHGFSVIDCHDNGELRIQFYIDEPQDSLTKAFEAEIPFQLTH
ncbi:metallophosphoesterase [Sphingobacterium hotanense]|uniref:metallophosphoesterase n=1 Tax=Sphingobacterium hotanense TaxID=649196 RepID=UPI0011F1E5E6|nr:metallophosphoesterase [Sphingobacterium hotanense]